MVNYHWGCLKGHGLQLHFSGPLSSHVLTTGYLTGPKAPTIRQGLSPIQLVMYPIGVTAGQYLFSPELKLWACLWNTDIPVPE